MFYTRRRFAASINTPIECFTHTHARRHQHTSLYAVVRKSHSLDQSAFLHIWNCVCVWVRCHIYNLLACCFLISSFTHTHTQVHVFHSFYLFIFSSFQHGAHVAKYFVYVLGVCVSFNSDWFGVFTKNGNPFSPFLFVYQRAPWQGKRLWVNRKDI